MAWELEIHIIDVGQGESSLIIAEDSAAAPPNNYRAMLIDGGNGNKARTVDNYVKSITERKYVNRIVTTHYDNDHSGGVTNILIAENLHILARILAMAAGQAAYASANSDDDNGKLNQIGAAAAAVFAAGSGAYDDGNGNDYRGIANEAGKYGQELSRDIRDDATAANHGEYSGDEFLGNYQGRLNAPLIPTLQLRKTVARQAGLAAGRTNDSEQNRWLAAYRVIHNLLADKIEKDCDFRTEGRYGRANIIDVGDFSWIKRKYIDAIAGSFMLGSNNNVTIPTNRIRQTPALGGEILWNSGNNAMPAPPGAPAVYVVAFNRSVRHEPQGTQPFVGDPQNRVSLGLIIRFNNFFYFTGGDLPFEGEDRMLAFLLGQANVPNMADNTPNPVLALGFANPNPPPTHFLVPNHICCFKASHHGSAESTSAYFVNHLNARAAFISAGKNDSFAHPTERVIAELHNSNSIYKFYMTNCNYARNYVPGAKSQIAGDNNQDNLATGRERGDIVITVNEAESLSATHPPAPPAAGAVHHSFRVLYWDSAAGVTTARHSH